MTSGDLTFDMTQKMTEVVSLCFLRSFECRLLHVATWPRSRVRADFSTPARRVWRRVWPGVS